jgi:hypothetical protein
MQPPDEVQSDPDKLELTVEQEIHRRTFRRVHNLRVELIKGQIVAHGKTRADYDKLLALGAAREVGVLICPIPLLMDIQVA